MPATPDGRSRGERLNIENVHKLAQRHQISSRLVTKARLQRAPLATIPCRCRASNAGFRAIYLSAPRVRIPRRRVGRLGHPASHVRRRPPGRFLTSLRRQFCIDTRRRCSRGRKQFLDGAADGRGDPPCCPRSPTTPWSRTTEPPISSVPVSRARARPRTTSRFWATPVVDGETLVAGNFAEAVVLDFIVGSARVMKSFQIPAGKSPPTTPRVGVLSSLPTQTPTTKSCVKPTNQASR